jgi:hypothetical protein
MTNKRYVMNASIILWIGVVLMLFIFILVAHHQGLSDRVRQDRSVLLGTPSSVAEGIKPVGQVSAPSAETQREPVPNAAAAPSPNPKGK